MLEAVQNFVPSLLPLVHSASLLFREDKTIQSAEDVQQGDPLGPLLFCLTIHQICSRLKSELCLFYLDDGTLGGKVEDLKPDLDPTFSGSHTEGEQCLCDGNTGQ